MLARAAKVLLQELELVEEQEADLDMAALWAAAEEVAPRAAVVTATTAVTAREPGRPVARGGRRGKLRVAPVGGMAVWIFFEQICARAVGLFENILNGSP